MASPKFSNEFVGSRFTGTKSNGMGGVTAVQFDFDPSIAMTARRLFALEKSIKSFRVPLETSIREVMRPSIRENFDVGGRPKWDALSEVTKKRKKGSGILVETGKLKRVASQKNIWEIGRYTAVIKGGKLLGDVPYALYMQAGTYKAAVNSQEVKNERGKTEFKTVSAGSPPRPYLIIQEEDKAKIAAIFTKWIDSRIAAKWGGK